VRAIRVLDDHADGDAMALGQLLQPLGLDPANAFVERHQRRQARRLGLVEQAHELLTNMSSSTNMCLYIGLKRRGALCHRPGWVTEAMTSRAVLDRTTAIAHAE
jgi:hypothetical protein